MDQPPWASTGDCSYRKLEKEKGRGGAGRTKSIHT